MAPIKYNNSWTIPVFKERRESKESHSFLFNEDYNVAVKAES